MDDIRSNGSEQEPMGIVISRGSRGEAVPRLQAYVWGQVEEPSPEPVDSTKVAA